VAKRPPLRKSGTGGTASPLERNGTGSAQPGRRQGRPYPSRWTGAEGCRLSPSTARADRRPDPSRALHARPWGRRPDRAPRAGCVSEGSIRWSHGGMDPPPPGDRRETPPRDTSRTGHPGAKAATRPGGKGAPKYATPDPRLERSLTRTRRWPQFRRERGDWRGGRSTVLI
jgi:hypothetical protein